MKNEELEKLLKSSNRNDVLEFVIKFSCFKENENFFANNINYILRKCRVRHFGKVIEELSKIEKCRKALIEKFDSYCDLIIMSNVVDVLKTYVKYEEYKILIEENIDTFLDCAIYSKLDETKNIVKEEKIKEDDILLIDEIYEILSNYNDKTRNIIIDLEKRIKEDKDKIPFIKKLNRGILYRIYKYNALNELEKQILENLNEKSNNILSDIKYREYGFFNTVLSYKNKIIKIGKKKVQFEIPFSYFVLQPNIRKEIYKDDNFLYTLEITDLVDTKSVNEKDLEYLLDKLKKENKEWLDSSVHNIGKLYKNQTNERKNTYKNLGMKRSKYLEENKKGIVIIDSDMLFTKKDSDNWKRRYK